MIRYCRSSTHKIDVLDLYILQYSLLPPYTRWSITTIAVNVKGQLEGKLEGVSFALAGLKTVTIISIYNVVTLTVSRSFILRLNS